MGKKIYNIIRRLDWIRENMDRGINCTDIAAEWDCSPKTASRDIGFLRSHYGLRIEYDQSKKYYFLRENNRKIKYRETKQ